MTVFSSAATRAPGYALLEADWDYIKNFLNGVTWNHIGEDNALGSSSSMGFAGIPGTYSHLLLYATLRSTEAAVAISGSSLNFNVDLTGNYDFQFTNAQAAVTSTTQNFAQLGLTAGSVPASTAPDNWFSTSRILIPNYANSTKLKSCAVEANVRYGTVTTRNRVQRVAGFWRQTAAITNVAVIASGGNWTAGSKLSLYGIN